MQQFENLMSGVREGKREAKKKRKDVKAFSSSSLLLQRVKNNRNTELTYLPSRRGLQRPQRSALKHQLAKNALILTDIGAFYILSVGFFGHYSQPYLQV